MSNSVIGPNHSGCHLFSRCRQFSKCGQRDYSPCLSSCSCTPCVSLEIMTGPCWAPSLTPVTLTCRTTLITSCPATITVVISLTNQQRLASAVTSRSNEGSRRACARANRKRIADDSRNGRRTSSSRSAARKYHTLVILAVTCATTAEK